MIVDPRELGTGKDAHPNIEIEGHRARNEIGMWFDGCNISFMNLIYDKFVCVECLIDEGLKKFFHSGRVELHQTDCDYCDNTECQTIAVEDVQRLIQHFVDVDYGDPIDILFYESGGGGWQGKTFEVDDVFSNVVGCSACDNLECNLQDHLNYDREYCEIEPMSLPDQERWEMGWNEFRNTIQHKYRFFFGSVSDLVPDRHPDEVSPKDFFHYFDVCVEKLNAVRTVPRDSLFYRCRVADAHEKIETFEHIGPPSNDCAIYPNRFSPAGIPMFYVGEDVEICKAEIDWDEEEGKKLVVGDFRLLQDVGVLDLTALQTPSGNLDPDWIGQYHIDRFFRGLIRDMTGRVEKDGREHIDYIPTQMICEYLRYFKADVDGVCFPSSRDANKKSYVFFYDCDGAEKHFELSNITEAR